MSSRNLARQGASCTHCIQRETGKEGRGTRGRGRPRVARVDRINPGERGSDRGRSGPLRTIRACRGLRRHRTRSCMEVVAGDGADDIRGHEDSCSRKCGRRNGRRLRSRPRARTGCDRSTRSAQQAAALASLRLTARGALLRRRSMTARLAAVVRYALL